MTTRLSIRNWPLLSGFAVAALVAGCAGTPRSGELEDSGETPAKKADQAREAPAKQADAGQAGDAPKADKPETGRTTDAGRKPQGPPPDGRGGGGGGNKMLEDLARLSSLKEQERKAMAQHYLKTARAKYNSFNYRDAAADLEVAVKADPENEEIRRLYEKTLWILGDRRGEIFDMARELADARVVAVKQMQIEVDRLFREGELLVSKERYDSAIERFERVLETIRWFPYNVSRDELQKRAEVAISKARDLRGEQLRRFRRQRQQAAIEEAKAEKAQSLRYRNARLKALYRNALEAYKAERYTRCEELCEEILRARPSDLQTSRLRRAAIEARHRASVRQTYHNKVEHMKRQLEWIDESSIPYQSIFEFPSRDEWLEIAKREITVKDFDKTGSSPEAEEINRRLASQRVNLNFDATPFLETINFLRDITGLNFVVSKGARDVIETDSLEVSLRLKEISLKNALQLILSVNSDLKYAVKDSVVVITTKDADQIELFLEFYEVSDIINKIPDFPAPGLGLQSPQGGGGGGGAGGASPGGVLSFDDDAGEENQGVGVGAEKLQELVERVGGDTEGTVDFSGGILIVRKPAEVHKKIIQLLDALRKTVGIMVTVEARFVEVQDNFLETIGVDLTGLPQNINGPRGSAFPPVSAGYTFTDAQGENNVRASMINLLSNAVGNGSGNPFNLIDSGGSAFQYNVITDQFQLQAILEAVKKKQRARLVSAPRVTVFNGQRAHLLSINQRAYIQDVEVNQTGVIPVLNPVIGILNTGSILDVRPTVSHDRRYVSLEVRPTLAQQSGTRNSIVTLAGANTSIPIELPTIVVQKIRTTVTVPDGGTVLIGGLKDLQETYNETLVPFVGKLPVIKNLFRRQGYADLKRSTVVLLKARITILREEEDRRFGTTDR